jgi:hypothetical protein
LTNKPKTAPLDARSTLNLAQEWLQKRLEDPLGQRTMITGLSGAAVADHDDFGEPAT